MIKNIKDLKQDTKKELAELRKERRALNKLEKELLLEQSLEKDMEKWSKIMTVKEACKKVIKDANLGMRMDLHRLAKFPTFYIYQHPIHKKLKTSNREENWVKEYCGDIPMGETGGIQGTEKDLLTTARKSTIATWKRHAKKGKTTTKKDILKSRTNKLKRGKNKLIDKVGAG